MFEVFIIADGIEIKACVFLDLLVETLDHVCKPKPLFGLLLRLLWFGLLLADDHEEQSTVSDSGLIEFGIVLEKFAFVIELGSIEGHAGLGFKKSLDVFYKLVVIDIEVGDRVSVSDCDFHF